MAAPLNGAGLSRRGFLVGSGGVLAALALAACAPGGTGSASRLNLLLPGDAAADWSRVSKLLNAKLKEELGFEFNAQYIPWAEYATQSALKFTAGENFGPALSAKWLNMAKLISDKAILNLDDVVTGGKYPNLVASIDPAIIDANRWGGSVYGIPNINSAGRIHHYSVRQDLVDKYASGSIDNFDAMEKFWYDVKQNEEMMGIFLRYTKYHVLGSPTGVLFPEGWEDPSTIPLAFTGDSLQFVPSKNAASTGTADLVPFWEYEPYVNALHSVRKWYNDGIINADMLAGSPDETVIDNGRVASWWAMTDGLASGMQLKLDNGAGGTVGTAMPFGKGIDAKPNQTFQADNLTVVNSSVSDPELAYKLLDWVSVKENHDLLQYGVEGEDFNYVGEDRWEKLHADYAFPGYALSWRMGLELKDSKMSESEDKWFTWAQDVNNFTTDPFATFQPDLEPVSTEDAQVTAAFAEFGAPLLCGQVEVEAGLDALKKALQGAGYEKLQEELNTQANAHLKENS